MTRRKEEEHGPARHALRLRSMARVINRNQDSEPTPSGSYTRSQQATDEALRLAPHQIRFAGARACCCDGLSLPRVPAIWAEAIRRWLPICRSVTSVTPVFAAWAIVTDSLGCRPSTRSTDFRLAQLDRLESDRQPLLRRRLSERATPETCGAAMYCTLTTDTTMYSNSLRLKSVGSKIAVAPVEPTGDPESDKARDTYK
ncbi:hypothetical protein C8034_v006364 [Colletotrichum sidae]|uniref:Uncharacterized protein n=1 Tax=Colletotrichum sidae TaxID=1347389 RepID=A0A4R8TTC8_9PEZI|nr:hypothetical protein C8034_v006364 [Colletotrichum sidae]